jgi:Flp pilus assembly protein TadG
MSVLRDRRGAVAALGAIVMIGVVGFAGLAIDITRVWMVNARLKTAIDAASLVAARQISVTPATRDALVTNVYWANYNQNGRWTNNYLFSTALAPTIAQIDDERIQVTGSADVPTTLFSIIERGTTRVTDSAIARREGTGLEVAIVLDQTASMLQSAPGFDTKLQAAQNAVRTMLGRLYGPTDDTRRNLWFSVVPFARTVNIGTANAGFLDTTGMPAGWSQANWSGCVEARSNGDDDITDLGPLDVGGLLRPYYYQSTYRRVGYILFRDGTQVTSTTTLNNIASDPRNLTPWDNATRVPATGPGLIYAGYTVPLGVGVNACTNNSGRFYTSIPVNLYASSAAGSTTAYTVAFCRGDNDFTNPNGLSACTGAGASCNAEYNSLIGSGMSGIGLLPTSAAGPNRLCAQSPILPLTASRAAVQAAVDAIVAPARSGGTTAVTGMQGAWYTLSPRWQSQWPNIATNSTIGTLPLPYNTRNMTKAVIILTDGDNNWQALYGGSSVRGSPTASELLYNAYGRVANWNTTFPADQIALPPTQSSADARLDSRFAQICEAMKGPDPNNPRMTIYVIGFEIGNPSSGNATAVRNMLQQCATRPEAPYFLEAPSAAALEAAFTQVANSLASLRLLE